MIIDRRTANPIARLRPIPDTDRFELFYWSNVKGIVEADEMDFRRCLEIQRPYLGPVVGVYTDWTPIDGRDRLFPESLDRDDPWQFSNVLVR